MSVAAWLIIVLVVWKLPEFISDCRAESETKRIIREHGKDLPRILAEANRKMELERERKTH